MEKHINWSELVAERSVCSERIVPLIKLLDTGLAYNLLTSFVLYPDEIAKDLPLIEKEVFTGRASRTSALSELLLWYRDKQIFSSPDSRVKIRPKQELAIFRKTA